MLLRSGGLTGARCSRARIARRVGMAVALAATLGQLFFVAHPETSLPTATHAASASEHGAAAVLAAAAHATPHDSAQCPTCRAAAQARTALRAASLARASSWLPRLEVVCFDSKDLPDALARSTVVPRAPPA